MALIVIVLSASGLAVSEQKINYQVGIKVLGKSEADQGVFQVGSKSPITVTAAVDRIALSKRDFPKGKGCLVPVEDSVLKVRRLLKS